MHWLKLDTNNDTHINLLKYYRLKATNTDQFKDEVNCKHVITIMVLDGKIEIINDNEFLNYNIGSNWIILPNKGYVKGMHRFWYRYYGRVIICEEMIADTI